MRSRRTESEISNIFTFAIKYRREKERENANEWEWKRREVMKIKGKLQWKFKRRGTQENKIDHHTIKKQRITEEWQFAERCVAWQRNIKYQDIEKSLTRVVGLLYMQSWTVGAMQKRKIVVRITCKKARRAWERRNENQNEINARWENVQQHEKKR